MAAVFAWPGYATVVSVVSPPDTVSQPSAQTAGGSVSPPTPISPQPPISPSSANPALAASSTPPPTAAPIQPASATAQPSVPTPVPTFVLPPTSAPTSGGYPGEEPLDAALIEEWIIIYTNEAREERGLRPLQHDPAISDIARAHSKDMATTGIFSHRIGGSNPTDRALATGYDCRADLGGGRYSYGLAENIAKHPRVQHWQGTTTLGRAQWRPTAYHKDAQAAARGMVNGWMNSPGHKDNILNASYRRIGVGVSASVAVARERGWQEETFYGTQNFSSCR